MKVLVIGGTAFLGRATVEAALARCYEVTLLNRGKTNGDLFPGVARLYGDRNNPADLEQLKSGRWDAAIDTCGYLSASVGATVEALSDQVDHYTFISSISVYADNGPLNQDESAPVLALGDGPEDAADMQTYGARKARCEQVAEALMPGRVLNLRAGLLVGPHDYIDRFPYWVGRIAQGGEVLAPDGPEHPLQLIDVRDLAAWNLHMAATGQAGVFNADGPDYDLTLGATFAACREASGSSAEFTWMAEDFLLEHNVAPFSELPLWLPNRPEYAGFMAYDCRKAQAAGLRYRPIVETARDTLEWLRTRPAIVETRPAVVAQGQLGLTPKREQELLAAWHSRANI
jgi:2'-hydroxyisoflavone reductase